MDKDRQRKAWDRIVNDLYVNPKLDKPAWIQGIKKGEISLKAFLVFVDENAFEREV